LGRLDTEGIDMSETTASKTEAFLRRIVDPSTTAVLTMELQRGVVDGAATLPALVEEVRRAGLLDVARRVTAAARQAGARVVHCTFVARPDGLGNAVNCKIFAVGERFRREHGYGPTDMGTPGAELVEGLEEPSDFVVARLCGMTPFTSTSLDQILRNLGVTTIVAMGVSVNLGIMGLSLSALDHGYQVVVVRDGVVGLPPDYARAVIENSLSMIATVVTSEELLAAWSSRASDAS
jgi:nicotinamidase-related amidase